MISVITTCVLATKRRTAPTANAFEGIVLLSFEYLRSAKRFRTFGEMANHTMRTHPHCRMPTLTLSHLSHSTSGIDSPSATG